MKIMKFMIFFFLFLVVACGRASNDTYAEEIHDILEETPYHTPEEIPCYIPHNAIEPYKPLRYDVFSSGSTRGEYLDDLDFLYATLRENFPFFDTILRSYGVDMHVRYMNTREHIESRNDFPSDMHFAATLNNFFLVEARGVGHMSSILDSDILLANIQLYRQLIEQGLTYLQPFLDEFNNSATRSLYDLTDMNFILPDNAENIMHATTSNNIHTYIIEEGRIAYVNILEMNFFTMELDRITLLDFFYQVADYDHLVIDIRQNRGGFSSYFQDLVIAPNISYPLRFENYVFFMGGEHNRRLLAHLFDKVDGIRPVNHDVIAHMTYFHHEAMNMLSYYYRLGFYIEPSYDTGIFNGKIWLLVGSQNVSGAEVAVAVAKQTGFATLVGHQTGGGGMINHPLAETFFVALPNTGIIVRYVAGYRVDDYGRENYEHGTQPHHFNRQGMDALETVLVMIDEGNY